MVGHSEIRTTLGTYGHLFPGAGQEIADGLDTLLGGSAPEGPVTDNVRHLRAV
jgi:hypothetical protein